MFRECRQSEQAETDNVFENQNVRLLYKLSLSIDWFRCKTSTRKPHPPSAAWIKHAVMTFGLFIVLIYRTDANSREQESSCRPKPFASIIVSRMKKRSDTLLQFRARIFPYYQSDKYIFYHIPILISMSISNFAHCQITLWSIISSIVLIY